MNGQTQWKRDMRALGLRTDFHVTPVIFRHENYFAQPWVQGLVPCAFDNYWKYLDIDVKRRNIAAP